MLNNEIKVSVVRGSSMIKSDYKEYKYIVKDCDIQSKIDICKSLLKIEITRLIEPILYKTELSNFEITNKLIDDIDLLAFVNFKYKTTNPLLNRLVNGSLYRIAIEASSITDKDYAHYLNSISDEVASICDSIIQLLNS